MERDVGKGNTHTMILAVLSSGPLHGYAIAREIERRSENVLTCQEGVLYPGLRALEREGLIQSNWEIQQSGPARKVYTLTDAGKHTLQKRAQAWRQLQTAMSGVLGGKPDEQTT